MVNSQNKILFITTTSPAVNPRLVKELKLASSEAITCRFIYFRLGNWADQESEEMVNELEIPASQLDATRHNKWAWFLSTLIQLLSKSMCHLVKNLFLTAMALDRRSWILHRFLNKQAFRASLIVAHNPGALFPAWFYSKRHNIPFAFDMEDYHPGETNIPVRQKRSEFLLKKILPHSAYISYASPLIGEYALRLTDKPHPYHFLTSNSFPQDEFSLNPGVRQTGGKSASLKLIWFSQNIAAGRGLEMLIMAVTGLPEKIELHLVGNLYESFYEEWIKPHKEFIIVHKPVKRTELHRMLADYDVGLAIEPGKDLNNEIAVSNKIFACIQAGLYTLVTNTAGQRELIHKNPWCGVLCEPSELQIQSALESIINNLDQIRKNKEKRFEKAKALAWENESGKLLSVWEEVIPGNE